MARKYHTLCGYDVENGAWVDLYGSYDKQECRDELEWNDDASLGGLRIVTHEDSAAAMMAARDALAVPAKFRKAVQ